MPQIHRHSFMLCIEGSWLLPGAVLLCIEGLVLRSEDKGEVPLRMDSCRTLLLRLHMSGYQGEAALAISAQTRWHRRVCSPTRAWPVPRRVRGRPSRARPHRAWRPRGVWSPLPHQLVDDKDPRLRAEKW